MKSLQETRLLVEDVEVILLRKAMRTLRVVIRPPDGRVLASAPLLMPESAIRAFYARAFAGRIRPGMVLGIPTLVFVLFAAAAAAAAFLGGSNPGAVISFDPGAFLGTAVLMLFLGPSGVESAWRGYLRPRLEGRYGFLKGNILLGLVWAFWHAPLWVLASEFRGLEGLVFAGANVVVLASLTVILGVLMKRSDNLLVAFWTHYCFNVSLSLWSGGIGLFAALSVAYPAAAAILAAVFRTRSGSLGARG